MSSVFYGQQPQTLLAFCSACEIPKKNPLGPHRILPSFPRAYSSCPQTKRAEPKLTRCTWSWESSVKKYASKCEAIMVAQTLEPGARRGRGAPRGEPRTRRRPRKHWRSVEAEPGKVRNKVAHSAGPKLPVSLRPRPPSRPAP